MDAKLRKWIDDATEYYHRGGETRKQARSLAWAEYFEGQEIKYGFSYTKRYDCYCKDCNEGRVFGCAGSIRLFITMHQGHNTRTVAFDG